MRDGQTNNEQGSIMLLSLSMLEGWVSQKQYELEIFLRFHISNTDHIIDVVEGRQVYILSSQQSRVQIQTDCIMIFILANHICSTPASAINIVCPHYQGFQDRAKKEQHIIYNVKESFLLIPLSLAEVRGSFGTPRWWHHIFISDTVLI